MGEVLEKIMESSRKGYIGSWDKINKILGEIAALSLRDMSAMLGREAAETGMNIAQALLNEEHGLGLEPDVTEGVQLMEILCLVDGTKKVLGDRDFDEEQEALNRRYIRRKVPFWYTCISLLLHIFREAQKKDALFRQFWCIGLEDLMDSLDALDYIRHPMQERMEEYYWGEDAYEEESHDDEEACGEEECCDGGEAYGEECYGDWEPCGEEESHDDGEPCGEEECCDDREPCGEEEFEPMEVVIDLDNIDYDFGNEFEADDEEETYYEDLKEKFYRRAKALQISLHSGITIGETLEQASKVTWERWRPSESIYTYAGRILTAYRIIDFLLAGSFRFRDPEHFCLDSILEKYRKLSG